MRAAQSAVSVAGRYFAPLASGELAIVAAWQAAALIVTAFSVKALTGLLGPSEYGRLALLMTFAALPNMLVFGPLGQGIARFLPVVPEGGPYAGLAGAAFSMQRRAAAAVLILAAGVAAFAAWGVIPLYPLMAFVAVSGGIAAGLHGNIVTALTARRERLAAGFAQAVEPAVRLLGAAALVRLAPTAEWALVGGFVGTSVVALALRGRSVGGELPAAGREDSRRLLLYVLPFTLGAMPALVVAHADRWIVGACLDHAAVGQYVLAAQVAAVSILPVVGLLNQYFMPVVFAAAGGLERPEQARVALAGMTRWTVLLVAAALPMIAAACYWAGPIVMAASRTEFAGSAAVLPLALASTTLLWVGNIGCIEAEVLKRPMLSLAPKLIHAAAIVALGMPMTSRWGLRGMAFAGLASAALFAASTRILIRKELRSRL